jgi:hypothetical protein
VEEEISTASQIRDTEESLLSSWIKLYTEMLHDPKLIKLDYAAKWFFVECLLLAGRLEKNGLIGTSDDVSLAMPKGEKGEKGKLKALAREGLVQEKKGVWYVTNFTKRQMKPSDSKEAWADRKRKQREKMSRPNSPALEGGTEAVVTPCPAIERTEQSRAEQKERKKEQELASPIRAGSKSQTQPKVKDYGNGVIES